MPQISDELKLITDAQKSDEKAWSDLFAHYSKFIWSATAGFNFPFKDREDIVQEVFVKLIRYISNYNPEKASFSTYISIITKNICIDKIRKKKERTEVFPDVEELSSMIDSNDNQEMIDSLKKALENELSFKQRLVIKLFYIENFSYKEIAEIMNRDYHWVKNTLQSARQYLKKVLR